ncbi:MAG TPA: TIGR03118 family protein [Candidatus Acidoferrum sp.]|nr:TIGR03118 family protein [Candidatus Acidoferrum sp.]
MKKALSLFGLLMTLAIPSGLWAQQGGYSQANLVSNVAGAAHTDTQLLNPWGISVLPGQDFWIADNNSGVSTLYDQAGNKDTGLVVTIPGATTNPNGNCSPGCPTGTVSNATGSYFAGGSFIFDTEDGLVVYWNGSSNTAIVGKDNSASGAVYKGLAILGTNLLAANFNSGKVDVYDTSFNLAPTGTFVNPNLPAGLAPHGIHVIGNQVYVAYAMQDGAKHDAVPGAGAGQVDIFDATGKFVSTFVAAGANNNLNAPWGVVAAPASFGAFANDILVGNFGDGTISAFDTTGKFIGQLNDASGKVLVNSGLWDMIFGGGGGSTNNPGTAGTLYVTAGGSAGQPNFPTTGGSATAVFAAIAPAAAAGAADFSLSASAQSATLPMGGSTTLMIGAAAVGGFNGQITLSCTAPAGVTCALNPSVISPGSSASASTLTIAAAAAPPPNGGYSVPTTMAFMPIGLFGTLMGLRKRKLLTRKSILWTSILGSLLLMSMFTLGCGSNSKAQTATTASQLTLTVTGTSGSLSHSTPVTLTIN